MTKLMLKGEEVDLSAALPLKVADWRALEKVGISIDSFTDENSKMTIEKMTQVALRILGKAGKDEAFVNDLSLDELTSVFAALGKKEAEPVNRPT